MVDFAHKIRSDGSKALMIESFEAFAAAILSDNHFESLEAHAISKDCISINSNGIKLYAIANSVFSCDESEIASFINEPDACVCCVGNSEELANISTCFLDPEVQTISLPLSLVQLDHNLRSFFRMQSMILNKEQQSKSVSQTSDAIKYVLSVSRELNKERNIDKLLTLILSKAREITNADAGSIYVVESGEDQSAESRTIHFKITQNDTVEQNLTEFTMPVSETSIVGNAVIHEKAINIPDLYHLDKHPLPYKVHHDKSWEQRIGYECRSMLTLPMFDISHEVIGVIQLINHKIDSDIKLQTKDDFETKISPFTTEDVEYAEIVAQQAGIALENAMLTAEKEALFEGFVHASVTAIEQRDPTTSGHSHRVAKLTTEIAKIVDSSVVGPYAKFHFTPSQMKEIEFASLLHDFGKLGVREHILTKSKKLYPDQLRVIEERFRHIRSRFEVEHLREVINYLQGPNLFPPEVTLDSIKHKFNMKNAQLSELIEFVLEANEPTVLEQGGFERLNDIANLKFNDTVESKRPYLFSDELKALSVSRGSLTREEFSEIQSHVTHTYEFLRKIPWGRDLSNVPQFAAKHHEKLDGSGYPTSAEASEIPVQTRMMTIADIFDALTAADRPYKRAVPVDKALEILEMEVKAGKCDSELFSMFIESKVYTCVLTKGSF